MFFSLKRHQQERAHDERDADTSDRDLVALANEARTPRELGGVVTLARMRRDGH